MNKSPEIGKLAAALWKFRAIVYPVAKDKVNPHFRNSYASLDAISEAIKQPLMDSGLALTQFPDGAGLTTLLMHPESGEWIEAHYEVPLSKQDPQGAGSALTYMRRYALGAVLGLSTEEDDDGEAASKPKAGPLARNDEPFGNDLNSANDLTI